MRNKIIILLSIILFSFLGQTIKAQQCGADIYVLNDNSGSVDAVELRQSREFITRLALEITPLGLANNQTRISISDFAYTNTFTEYNFPISTSRYTTELADIVSYENSPRVLTGGTDVGDGAYEASLVAGLPAVPGRNVAQILVILTDAYDFQIPPSIISFANTLKSRGFSIIVMAIDDAVADLELPQVASPGGYFTAGDYQALATNVITYARNLATQACSYQPPTPRPDLSMSLSNFSIINCTTTPSSSVNYTVNNVGNTGFSGNLVLSLYDADPRVPGANLLGVYNAGATTIAAGGSVSGTISNTNIAGLNSASTLYAVVNFNGNTAGNQVPISAQPAASQLAVTTPVAENITTNNFSPGVIINLGTGCNTAILDMKVSSNGGACDDEVTYSIQVCNNGQVAATLDGLLAGPAPGFTLFSGNGFCSGVSTSYSQIGQDITGSVTNDYLGNITLSSNGYTLLASADLASINPPTNNANGYARVYDYNQVSGQWVQRGVTIWGLADNDRLGWHNDITADGNTIAIGSSGVENGAIFNAGSATVYKWNSGSGQWVQVGNTILGTYTAERKGGVSISDDGQWLMVQAIGSSSDSTVETYQLVGSTWTKRGPTFTDGVANSFLGSYGSGMSISSNGSRIFIGAWKAGTNGFTENGQIRSYDWDGSSWVAKPFIDGPNNGSRYGAYLDATPDGNTMATMSASSGVRYASVYTWNGTSWVLKGSVFPVVGTNANEINISENGNKIIVGGGGSSSVTGIYEFDGSNWVLIESLPGSTSKGVAINSDGSIVSVGNTSANSNTGLVKVYKQDACTILPGECKTTNYVYNVSAAAAGTYDFDVVLNASKVNAAHADPIINPNKNFTLQNTATTGSGWDGSAHPEEDVTLFGAAFCATTHTMDIAVDINPSAVCQDGYTTAKVTITNPYPVAILATNLELNLGNGSTYASEPYNRTGILLPTFPGLDGTTGSKTIPVYSLAPGVNTFDVDIAVALGTSTLTAQLIDIDPAYNNGSATTAQVSDNVVGNANPTVTGTCPAAVTYGAATISLNYTVTGAASIIWSSGSNGTFSNPNSGTTTYTINPQDEANGFVDFALSTKSSTGCDTTIICRVNITGVERDYGDAPVTYDLGASTIPVAAAHSLFDGLYLGATAPDAELQNQPSAAANLDIEDDGLLISAIAIAPAATTYNLPISVTNSTTKVAYANAFIDWNADGDFLDDNETGAAVTVPANSGIASYTINFTVPSGLTLPFNSYVRLRVALEESVVMRPFSAAGGGEVEDFYKQFIIDPCAITASNPDSDGDGISNACDLDDDNDGILDVVECGEIVIPNITTASWQAVNGGNISNISIGNVFISPNFVTINGITYDLRFELLSRYPASGAGSGFTVLLNPNISISNIVPSYAPHFTYNLNLVQAGSVTSGNLAGTPSSFSNVKIEINDLDNNWINSTDIGAFVNPIPSTFSSASKLSEYTIPTGQKVWGLTDYSIVDPIAETQAQYPNYRITGTFPNYNGSFTLLHGSIGTHSGNLSTTRDAILRISVSQCKDTDGDGIPDYLDLDSDGDGCSDAIEGGAAFTTSNLVTSAMTGGNSGASYNGLSSAPVTQNLGNTVGNTPTTLGVPTIANTGQTVGQSQNGFKNDCQDADLDGIADWEDLDDDNDGIVDTLECPTKVNDFITAFGAGATTDIFPSDFGLALNVKNQNVTADLSAKFGYPANSGVVIINIINASVHPTQNVWWTKNGEQPSIWKVSGTMSAFVGMAHDLQYYANDSKIFHIYDNADVIPVTAAGFANQTAVAGQWSITDTQSQKTLNNLNTNNSTIESANWRYINMNFRPKSFGFSTTVASADPNYAVSILLECDTDKDGVPNRLDLDSDGDGCSDAIEGDAAFITTNLVNSVMAGGNSGASYIGTSTTPVIQNLGNTVGNTATTIGIPTIAGTGQTIGDSQNGSISSQCSSACYKPGISDAGNTYPTKHGITALGRAGAENENWPLVRQSAWTILESKEKGFVVNRVATTAGLGNITNPVEGMMVYDEQADCLKIYTLKSGDTAMAWHCFTTQACPD